MSEFSRSTPVPKIAGLSVIAWVVIIMAGCSSQLSRVQTWDGETMEASQLAVLKAPAEIKIKEVNGQRVTNFLLDDLVFDYELLPGNNQVVFTYKTIWAKTGVVKSSESKVHVVETTPQQVTIAAQAGATYSFEVPKPENRRAAEAVVADFSGKVVDESGATVATITPYVESSAIIVASPGAPAAPATDNALNTLDGLKVLWKKASAEEKREFLDWAFQ